MCRGGILETLFHRRPLLHIGGFFMSLTEKIIIIFASVLLFYLASMIDLSPDRIVDCHIGNLVFELKAKDCN
jgi:hypothetical protein